MRRMTWSAAGVAALLLAACGDDTGTSGTGAGGTGGGTGGDATTTTTQSTGGSGGGTVEVCNNGQDDDADTLVDCLDTDDCATACMDSCGVAETVADPSTTMGSTAGHGDAFDGSCATAAGPEHVYVVTAAETGTLTAKVVSFSDMAVSIRTACDTAGSEVDCANKTSGSGEETAKAAVTAGETYYVIVEGGSAGGDFQLEIQSVGNQACDAAVVLSDPGTATGMTTGMTSFLEPGNHMGEGGPPSCGGGTPLPAAENVYVVTASQDGVMEATLDAGFDSMFYMRKGCADPAGESCADQVFNAQTMMQPTETAKLAVNQGDTVYLVVDGWNALTGSYTVHVATRDVVCGDGIVDPGEACDDGNMNDTDACNNACSLTVCDNPTTIGEGTVQGDLTGGGTGYIDLPCQLETAAPEDIYEVVANETGVMVASVTATAPADTAVEVRTACSDITSSLGCKDVPTALGADRVSVPVTQGQAYTIVVKGFTTATAGPYSLNVDIHPVVCGDGFAEGTEECDDGDMMGGDGCSATCTLEPTSCMMPIVLADPTDATFSVGTMLPDTVTTCAPGGDMVFSVVADQTGVLDVVTTPGTGIAIRPTCASMTGELRCDSSGLVSVPVTQGQTYFIIATPSNFGGATAFDLSVSTRVPMCGDGVKDVNEQCDTGGVTGTGCSATCQIEATETEANDTAMTADVFSSPWVGVISPQTDADYVAVTVPGPASTLTATVVSGPFMTCTATMPRIDSLLALYGTDGTTLLTMNDDITPGMNFCSSVTATNLAAGTYYLKVSAFGMTPGFDYGLNITVN